MAVKKKEGGKSSLPMLKREQGWDHLEAGEEERLEGYCREYMDFLSTAKTERMVHDALLAMARAKGYVDLEEEVRGGRKLKPGARVYRSCQGKTLMLMQVGRAPLEAGLNVIGGHSDSPRLDVKPCPIYQDDQMVLFDTHYYGGIRKYHWLAIPLALHGVVVKADGSRVAVHVGEDPADPVFCITDLLPHLDKDADKKTLASGVSGEALNVLVGSRPVDKKHDDKEMGDKIKLRLLHMLAEKYGLVEEDFCSAELEFVPAGPAREMGFDRSMILGYGHDDRVCTYAAVKALLDCEGVPERTQTALICDKEEIGSYGATGMDSTFFENTVAELLAATGRYDGLALRRCLERSRMLSADVNAVHDPGHAAVSSPNNMSKLNCGVTLTKYTGSRGKSGSSDASAEFVGLVRRIFNEAKVHWQISELGAVDVGGGGTIALYMARYGMDVIDCGVGVLSMHAPWEVVGKYDVYMTYKGYHAFYERA